MMAGPDWLREARVAISKLPSLRVLRTGRVPDAPALPVRDPWPGEPARGARLMRGEMEVGAAARLLRPGDWSHHGGSPVARAAAHSFTWLRDLRALGTDAARARARLLTGEWLAAATPDPIGMRIDVVGARLAAWLGHYDFFAASADDPYRHRLMARLVADARTLCAMLPDGRAAGRDPGELTALKGLVAAAAALPEHSGLMARALRLIPSQVSRQFLADGCHRERSPATQLRALQDLAEIRALLQLAQVPCPPQLAEIIERAAATLRLLRHGDGGFALFNGSREEPPGLIDLVLTQAGRGARAAGAGLPRGGFHRLQAGRTLLLVDAAPPPPPGLDRHAHAGVLSFEMSSGRDRLIVNCGAVPAGGPRWHDAMRATAAHSTLAIADTNSSALEADGLGRRPAAVEATRQEANGAHWLEMSHDGYIEPFGARHRRRLYLSENGEDLRGEDMVEAERGQAYAVRFHLHPEVEAEPAPEGDAVLLRLGNRGGWRLRAEGAKPVLEESLYLGGTEPRACRQVVLANAADGPQQVKWAITRVG